MTFPDARLPIGSVTAESLDALDSKIPDTALDQVGVAAFTMQSATIALRQLTGVTLLRIHSLQDHAALQAALSKCDITLPSKINHSEGHDPAALSLAPGEWLLFSEYLSFQRISQQILPCVDPHLTATLDQSASAAVFRISGTGAPYLLSKLGGLDFHTGITAGAHCARTRLQQAPVTLHYHRPGGQLLDFVFDLIVDRSLAWYTWQLLVSSLPHAEELNPSKGQPQQ